jgi:hypothetical protein
MFLLPQKAQLDSNDLETYHNFLVPWNYNLGILQILNWEFSVSQLVDCKLVCCPTDRRLSTITCNIELITLGVLWEGFHHLDFLGKAVTDLTVEKFWNLIIAFILVWLNFWNTLPVGLRIRMNPQNRNI